jgi:acetoin utilization deacetylase AcuC-like enzyme
MTDAVTKSLSICAISTALPSEKATSLDPSGSDAFDRHNKPRLRRDLILHALSTAFPSTTFKVPPSSSCNLVELYTRVHDVEMVSFLSTAWSKWTAMGEAKGYYEECCHPQWKQTEDEPIPPLIPCHAAFRNCPNERPSTNVMGAMGYYCTDNMTPIVASLEKELQEDAMIICHAVKRAFEDSTVVYAITTHPGHHANIDNFGGYCYLNNAALCARLMQRQLENGKCVIGDDNELVENYWKTVDESSSSKRKKCRVAIIDVDYHCGNGTSSIFYSDSSVFFTSIHCDPAIEYPFNQGYADQTGCGDGEGSNLHIPLAPGATWDGTYKAALEKAMDAIVNFDVAGLIVSLGLDTYDGVSIELGIKYVEFTCSNSVLVLCCRIRLLLTGLVLS